MKGRLARDAVDPLILDLLEWIGRGARPYAETLEAWRTSCPRLTVWEDANDQGLITRRRTPRHGTAVSLSAAGTELLRKHREPPSVGTQGDRQIVEAGRDQGQARRMAGSSAERRVLSRSQGTP